MARELTADEQADDVEHARATRDAAFVDNVSRHLRAHPQSRVQDDRGRPRPLTRQEADRLAQVALRAAAQWLAPTDQPAAMDAAGLCSA